MEDKQKAALLGKYALLFLGLMIVVECLFVFVLTPGFTQASGGGKILDVQNGYTPEEAIRQVEAYGEEGRKYYETIQQVDTLFPLLYALTFTFASLFFALKIDPAKKWLRWAILPGILGAAFDYSENACERILLTRFSESPFGAARLANVFGQLKFGFIAFAFAVVIALAVTLAVKSIANRRRA